MAQQDQSQKSFIAIMIVIAFFVSALYLRWMVALMDEQSAAGETYKGFGAFTVFLLWIATMAGIAGISFFIVRNRRPDDMDDSEAELERERAARLAEADDGSELSFEAQLARLRATIDDA
jgi:hypothetical protein